MMTGLIRRLVGVVVAAAPVALAVASLAWHQRPAPFPLAASVLAGAALFIALFNLWLSLGRPMYWRWRHPAAAYEHASGAPVIGNFLAIAALVAGFSTFGTSLVALLALLIDVGGAPWFVALTWRQEALWDSP